MIGILNIDKIGKAYDEGLTVSLLCFDTFRILEIGNDVEDCDTEDYDIKDCDTQTVILSIYTNITHF